MAALVEFSCRLCGQSDWDREDAQLIACVSCRGRPLSLLLIADRLDARWEAVSRDPERFWMSGVKFSDGPRTHLLRERAFEMEERLTEEGVTLLPPAPAFYPLGKVPGPGGSKHRAASLLDP